MTGDRRQRALAVATASVFVCVLLEQLGVMRQYSQDELEAQKLFRNRQRQNLMHSLQPSNLGAPSAQNYLDRLQVA